MRKLFATWVVAGATLGAACTSAERAADTASSAPSARPGPLLVVGIDGATFDVIGPLVKQGRLPTFERLMREGAWGPLETIEPTLSPAIWTTIATGQLPERHGILGFDGVPGQTMTTLPTSDMRRLRAFWNILSEHERTVGVIGWWATWPAEPVRGYIVSDRMAYTRMEAAVGTDRGPAEPFAVYPAELEAEVRPLVRAPDTIDAETVRRFMALGDDEVARLIVGRGYKHGDLLPEFKYVYESDRSTADIALALMKKHPTDVTAVGFYGVDAVSHLAWHFMQPELFPGATIDRRDVERFGGLIPAYYAFVDGLLQELIATAPKDSTVLVFSDHGFGPTGHLPWSGGHSANTPGAPIAPPGVLIMSGPAIKAGTRLERPHVMDVAPTILYLAGLPLAADMRGGVFAESIAPAFRASFPLRQVPTYEVGPRRRREGAPVADPALDAATRQRLCALGYVKCD